MRGPTRDAAIPELIPQLASPAATPPVGDSWLHEIKYDGYRLLARLEGGLARLISRNGKDWSDHFPTVVRALESVSAADTVLDGEVAVIRPNGRTSFQDLQNILSGVARGGTLRYFVFDLLYLEGEDWTAQPLLARKRRLATLLETLPADSPLQYSDHFLGNGRQVFEQACRLGLEGVISKRVDAPYRPGRGRDWLKVKCLKKEEFVVGGFTDPGGSRQGFGALLLGGYDDAGALRFAGRVGTGFKDAQLLSLRQRLDGLERAESPFVDGPDGREARDMHWVQPELVAVVAYAEMTDDGLIRHPSFEALREDKAAADVRLPSRPLEENDDIVVSKTVNRSARRTRSAAEDPSEVAGIVISNPDKVLYPETGVTKLELARHYARVAEHMLPFVSDRPLTLVRCPNGIADCFYQKHIEGTVPDAIELVPIREGGELANYAMVRSAAGLVALAQLGVLEVHTWGTSRRDLEHPDRVTLDFDPDPGVPWLRVVEAVLEMRGYLGELGLVSFLKTTGGKGLHVVVPIQRGGDWDEVKEFSRAVAARVAAANPGRYTLNILEGKAEGSHPH